MKNRELYEQHVNEGANIKQLIQDDHDPILSNCKKIFKRATTMSSKQWSTLKNVLREVENEGPTPLDALAMQIALVVKVANMIGDTRVHEALSNAGISVEVAVPMPNAALAGNSIDNGEWASVFGATQKPADTANLMKLLLEKASQEQLRIDSMEAEINTNHAQAVEQESEIKKSHYKKAVGLKVRSRKGPLDKDLDKVKKELQSRKESVEIFGEV